MDRCVGERRELPRDLHDDRGSDPRARRLRVPVRGGLNHPLVAHRPHLQGFPRSRRVRRPGVLYQEAHHEDPYEAPAVTRAAAPFSPTSVEGERCPSKFLSFI